MLTKYIQEPFNLVYRSTALYITHEAFYTRVTHAIVTTGELIAILLLLNMINLFSIPIDWSGQVIQINFSVGLILLLLLGAYFIYLDWIAGSLTFLILFIPLLCMDILQAQGYVFGWQFIVGAVAFYFACGIVEVLCHHWFDGARSSITMPKPPGSKLLLILYITLTNPFFFILFLMIGYGYKRETLGKAIEETYNYIMEHEHYKRKPEKLDKNGNPDDFYNKRHPRDIA